MKPHQLAACIAAANRVMREPKEGESTSDREGRAMRACFGAARRLGYRPQEGKMTDEFKGVLAMVKKPWDATYISSLPDSAFACVLDGGEKDDEGKTKPRSLRKLPHHNASVTSAAENESVDLPHLRNALAREPQADMPEADHAKARAHLEKHADALLPSRKAIHESPTDMDVHRALYEFLQEDLEVDPTALMPMPHPKYVYYGMQPEKGQVILVSWEGNDLFALPYTAQNGDVVFNWDELQAVVIDFVPKFSSIKSFKGADGRWRWISMSGSAFEDRDEEIVSRASLAAGVALGDETGERGPLRLYHVRKGADVGACEMQALAGCFLVETGTWDDTELAAAARTWVDNHQDVAGVSIGFTYSMAEVEENVYVGPIKIIERSLLNVNDAACPWTLLLNAGEGDKMGSKAQVAAIVGDALADQVFGLAEDKTKELIEAGVRYKEKDAEPAQEAAEPPAQPAEKEAEAAEVQAAVEPPAAAEAKEAAPPADDGATEVLAGLARKIDAFADQVGALVGSVGTVVAAVAELKGQLVASDGRVANLEQSLAVVKQTGDELADRWDAGTPRALFQERVRRPSAVAPLADDMDVKEPDAEAKQKAAQEQGAGGLFGLGLGQQSADVILEQRRRAGR
jgi:hypothetical protein